MGKEKRLIDIGKRMTEWNKLLKAYYPNMPCQSLGQFLLNAPTVDAVEVVRCKDCKHRKRPLFAGNDIYCDEQRRHSKLDDFCSYGERREGE